jgi:hypothetical protein
MNTMNYTYSVKDFCRSHGISRGLFYKLLRDGCGPRFIKAGRRTLITKRAAIDWRRRMETGVKTTEAA